MQIDIAQVDVVAHVVRAACQRRDLSSVGAARHACEVMEDDIMDIDCGWVLGAGFRVKVEVASIEHNGPVGVVNVNVLEGDVLDVAVASISTSPGLKAGTVLRDC